jgi:hypothetical protein
MAEGLGFIHDHKGPSVHLLLPEATTTYIFLWDVLTFVFSTENGFGA